MTVAPDAPAAVHADGLDGFREAAQRLLQDNRVELAVAFDAGSDVDELLARRAAAVDQVIREAWARLFDGEPGLALVATGGYGRAELFPGSDIDVLVLAEEDVQARQRAAIEAWAALLWDIGLAPGHAVRSVAQCMEAARAEVSVASALLEARFLAGDHTALTHLLASMRDADLWPSAAFLAAKRQEWRHRHARHDGTAYRLEPNIKDGPGGLRDIQTLGWVATRLFGVQGLVDLVPMGVLGEDEFQALERHRRALSRLRYGLHLVAGRSEERLLFDHQKPLAARFGLKDEHRDNLAVEQMMQGFFRSAALVQRIGPRLLQRFEEGLHSPASPIALEDPDFLRLGNSLALRDIGQFQRDPELILRLFRVWQAHPELGSLHSATARALGEALERVDAGFRANPRVRQLFVDILRDARAVPALERMARLGVLGRYIPAFGQVAGRMQYDLFHVYTVDEHTLAVLRNIDSFAEPSSAERFALGHSLWGEVRKPELLVLAGLFHDIAKGRGGDHSVLGALEARDFCAAHGFSTADTDLVAWLVRQHLVMSTTAQRKDISDPEVVTWFARQVGERERLDHLYLLTVADIAGTSPKLWNAWKDRLLADLHSATRFALRRGLARRVHIEERMDEVRLDARARLLAAGLDEATIDTVWARFPDDSFLRYRGAQIAWQTQGIIEARASDLPLVLVRPHSRSGAMEIFVYAADRDGLFASVVVALDRLGLSIVDARVVTSRAGMTLDTFQVLDAGMQHVEPQHRVAMIIEQVRGAVLAPSAHRPAVRRSASRYLKHFRVPLQVEFSRAGNRTQMTLVCNDRPGLLAHLAVLLRDHAVRVHDARIATFGERVEDFFLLSNAQDQPLDKTRCGLLADALRASLEPPQAS